nr:unnamed protein product [Digitaria exilis]
MPPSPLPAGGAARPRENQIARDRPSPPRPSRPPGSSSTAQHGHGGGADRPREYRISDPRRSLRRHAFPRSTDPSPRRPQGSVQVRPTLTPPPPLPEDLVEEVLLRFPPDDPACLVRAALVCRRWRRLICGPRFRRRFREFHRAPPMLGFFVTNLGDNSFFVRTSATCPRVIINGVAVG